MRSKMITQSAQQESYLSYGMGKGKPRGEVREGSLSFPALEFEPESPNDFFDLPL